MGPTVTVDIGSLSMNSLVNAMDFLGISINYPSARAHWIVDIGSLSINSLVNVMDSLVISINYPSARPPGMGPTVLTLGA